MERPREKLQFKGAASLSDLELLAILLGSGSAKLPLNNICTCLLANNDLKSIAAMDMDALCEFKGIGPARATTLLAAAEFSRRVQCTAHKLPDHEACYQFLKPLLAEATQLQYMLLLISSEQELLAFSEAGSVLPDITWITGLAVKAGAKQFLIGRNGWPAFSNDEANFLKELRAAASSLDMVCHGLLAAGPKRYKML